MFVTSRAAKNLDAVKTVDQVQQYVESLRGKPVCIFYNSRGQEMKEEGIIINVYRNIFTFEFSRNGQNFKSSFTYSDLLTNIITLEPSDN